MKHGPKDIEFSARRISRRGLILGAGQVAFMGVLGLRMRQMQVKQADEFRLLAEENRINMRLIAPNRGIIYDRNGVAIADNAQNYRIIIVREDAGDVDAVIAKLKQLIDLDEDDLQKSLRELNRRSPFVPVTLADRLSWEDIAEVAVNAPALPGITPDVGLSRHYPLGPDFAHIVGYVGPVSDYDLSKIDDDDPLLQIPQFQIGKVGVENKLERQLRGKAGTKRIEVSAAGRVMRELGRDDAQSGNDVQLTIDHRLQNFAQARLADQSAAAVVMDVTSGDLLAMASTPAFDPNKFVRGISSKDYGELTNNKYRPLANKTVQGTYPPGSTFKMMNALAGLGMGVVDPQEKIYCPGYKVVGGRRFHCWKTAGHGRVNMNEALEQSCDVYFYEIAQRSGIDRIAEICALFGLGQRHDLPMSAIAPGLIPTTQWKKAKHGQSWLPGDTLNAAIGQGYVLTSPLQLALMTARLASGRAVVPRLIRSVNGEEVPIADPAEIEVSRTHLNIVRRGMYSVSNGKRGTARGSRIMTEEMELAGKTGTSQVLSITAADRASGAYRNKDVPWERRDHALFVAYAPYDNPKYAISVVVEHGGGGSKAAAPPARDILLHALYGGLPPLTAYPSSQREKIRTMQEELPLRPPLPPGPGRSRA